MSNVSNAFSIRIFLPMLEKNHSHTHARARAKYKSWYLKSMWHKLEIWRIYNNVCLFTYLHPCRCQNCYNTMRTADNSFICMMAKRVQKRFRLKACVCGIGRERNTIYTLKFHSPLFGHIYFAVLDCVRVGECGAQF